MDYKNMADQIIKYSGGNENITDAVHCFTRIRLHLKDEKTVDIEKIKQINGVVGAQFQGGQFQIILGPHVGDVFKFVIDKVQLNKNEDTKESTDSKNKNIISKLLEIISQIFAPIIPAIVGAGVMKGILALLVVIGVLSDKSDTYTVLYMISDAAFYFLPFLLAVSASKKFKLNEFIGLSLAGVMLYPTLVNSTESIKFLGSFDIATVKYTSSVLPIILGIWFTSYVYSFFDKYIPKVLRLIVTPVATLLVAVPVTLIILGPLGYNVGIYVAIASEFLFVKFPLLAGLIIGALYPLIIVTGMHLSYFPVMLQNITKLGYELGFLAIGLFSNMATAGATLAVGLKTKDHNLKSVSLSASTAAALGTTEPAIYGVELKLKKPLIAVMISGSLVSGIALMLGLKCYGFVSPGLIALPVYISPTDGNSNNFIIAIVGSIASFILGFVLTWIMGVDAPKNKEKKEKSQNELIVESKSINKTEIVLSPMSGEIKELSTFNDETFSKELIGKGIVIIPNEEILYAPFDGTVEAIVPTRHALGLKSYDGVELLIHIGVDTYQLQGKYFELLVDQGHSFKAGDKLLKIDLNGLKSEKIDYSTAIVISNSNDYMDVISLSKGNIAAGENLLKIM